VVFIVFISIFRRVVLIDRLTRRNLETLMGTHCIHRYILNRLFDLSFKIK